MEKNWNFYFDEGIAFIETAKRSFSGEGKNFNNELLFNIVSMGMEHLMVALLLYNKTMPLSETVSGLARELKDFVQWPEDFYSKVRYLNKFVFLCTLDQTPMRIPDKEEMDKVMEIAEEVKQRVSNEVSLKATA